MKIIIQLVLFALALESFSQPTGHQKLFFEISDIGVTLNLRSCFKIGEFGSKKTLEFKYYQLLDISNNPSGFQLYTGDEFIYKTLMTKDHIVRIIKDKTDTMTIELLNCFNIYFLSIAFQKGNFRMYVNDGAVHRWNYNTLPYKPLSNENIVYDITPKDWRVFTIDNRKQEQDYFISFQFAKQQLLEKVVAPEDDPNFRNPRRIKTLKKEVADYNFDGQKDYREHKMNDSTRWNYFIYKDASSGYVLDTVLSSMDDCFFDFSKNKFVGLKTTRIDTLTTKMVNYEYIGGAITMVRVIVCVHAFMHSEKIDCSVSELENGKWVDKSPILGCE